MAKSTLAAGLKAAAAHKTEAPSTKAQKEQGEKTILIGAHFPPEVRSALFLLQAETGKTVKHLLGEAINDLCVKYRKPQPYNGEI